MATCSSYSRRHLDSTKHDHPQIYLPFVQFGYEDQTLSGVILFCPKVWLYLETAHVMEPSDPLDERAYRPIF